MVDVIWPDISSSCCLEFSTIMGVPWTWTWTNPSWSSCQGVLLWWQREKLRNSKLYTPVGVAFSQWQASHPILLLFYYCSTYGNCWVYHIYSDIPHLGLLWTCLGKQNCIPVGSTIIDFGNLGHWKSQGITSINCSWKSSVDTELTHLCRTKANTKHI